MSRKLVYLGILLVCFSHNCVKGMNEEIDSKYYEKWGREQCEKWKHVLSLSPEEQALLPLTDLEGISLGFEYDYYKKIGENPVSKVVAFSVLLSQKRKGKQCEFLTNLPKDKEHFNRPYVELDMKTPLYIAAGLGDIRLVHLCLTLGVDVNYADEDNETALTVAMCVGNAQITDLLLDAGARITEQDIKLANLSEVDRNKRK